LVHSAPFPEHSYTRGLETADAVQVLADNLPAFKQRLRINIRLAAQALFWAMGNHVLVVLMWVGLIVFLSRPGHRSLALALLAAMACVVAPHVLTFAWLRYFQPAMLFAVVIVAGMFDRLAAKWVRGRWREAAIAAACVLCSFPFGVTAGIAGLERISDPFCGEIRAGDRQYFSALGEFVQHEVRPEQTLVCDVPVFAAWYGDRTTIWLPNDLPTLQRLVDRANIDFMLLVFQFRRPGYDRFWREWLNRKVAAPEPENGLAYVSGLRTPRGAVFLFRTGVVYR